MADNQKIGYLLTNGDTPAGITMLDDIKGRLGIDSAVTVYDAELTSLIAAAIADMQAAGVPGTLLGESEDPETGIVAVDDRAKMAVTAFIRATYGDDRTSVTRYNQMYQSMVFRLCQEEGGT